MKHPQRIILIRHAESVRNVLDDVNDLTLPTYMYGITPLGEAQALDAGKRLKEIVGDGQTLFEVSDYARTRLTLGGILKEFADPQQFRVRLEPLLRERERPRANADRFDVDISPFYLQAPGHDTGETYVQTSDRAALYWTHVRMGILMETLPENLVVVSHGGFLSCLITHIYGVGHAGFMRVKGLDNTQIVVFEADGRGGYDSADPHLTNIKKFKHELLEHLHSTPNV